MHDDKIQFKHFEYQNKKYYYLIKDFDIIFRENKGTEIAITYMNIYDENYNHIDTFQISDEKMKVLNNFSDDAKIWYKEHLENLE